MVGRKRERECLGKNRCAGGGTGVQGELVMRAGECVCRRFLNPESIVTSRDFRLSPCLLIYSSDI